jgi:tetratricopeptide (TPR) repeat protein
MPVTALVPVVKPAIAASAVRALVNLPKESARIVPVDTSLKMDATMMEGRRPATAAKLAATDRPQLVSAPSPKERMLPSVDTVPVTNAEVPPSPVRRSPALDALAQAQSLWSLGSRDAAIELVRESLAVAERANHAGSPAGSNSVLASLARELARMELAEGRVSQVLAMLTRLEPALSGFADVWAMRGNVAQRLGRHEESASAYLMALKLRPDEPRWLLGAAVSLAAQGKTASAAELAEKARVGGVLSPDVATYLRQLGVTLR